MRVIKRFYCVFSIFRIMYYSPILLMIFACRRKYSPLINFLFKITQIHLPAIGKSTKCGICRSHFTFSKLLTAGKAVNCLENKLIEQVKTLPKLIFSASLFFGPSRNYAFVFRSLLKRVVKISFAP